MSDDDIKFEWTVIGKVIKGQRCRVVGGSVVGGVRKTNAGDYVWQCTVVGVTVSDVEKDIDVAKGRVETAARSALTGI